MSNFVLRVCVKVCSYTARIDSDALASESCAEVDPPEVSPQGMIVGASTGQNR